MVIICLSVYLSFCLTAFLFNVAVRVVMQVVAGVA